LANGGTGIDADRRARRRERERQVAQRRRAVAIGALVLLIAAVIAILAGGGGEGGGSGGGGGGGSKGSTAQSNSKRTSANTGSARGFGSQHANSLPAGVAPAPREVSAPILMYHVINPPPAGAPFPGLYVPTSEFAEQMQALARAGFHAVTLEQLNSHWRAGSPLPSKPVVITFDNGYQSQYTNALPVLQRLDWSGVENIQLTGLPPSQGGLSQAQVQSLLSAGWELNTQGISHADLITLNATQLREQIATSRQTLQRRYHVPVRWFCYPSGHYNATVIAAVREAGYLGSTTVIPGWASPSGDPYRLPRLRVLGGTSGAQLLELISATEQNPAPPSSYGT
jgi:peptidoglycan/xylan/chitin deacetylase (PgdA/CDA1 family)